MVKYAQRRKSMEQEYIKVNKEAYNKFADQHAQRHETVGKYDLTDEEWKKIITENLLAKDRRNVILEIGPGTGRMLSIFESLNCRTCAIELSHKMIEYAKQKSPHTVFTEGNVLEAHFENGIFDAIFMGAVIHNFPKEDAQKLLQLTYNWIRDDGRILIYTTIHEKSEEGFYEKQDYTGNIVRFRKKFTEQELKEMLEEAGFEITYTMHTSEPDRNKNWLTYIVRKGENK